MSPEEIPADLKAILDKAAGKEHSASGSVMACLAEILTAHDAMVCNMWADLLDVEANEIPDGWSRARGLADGMRRAARLLRGEESGTAPAGTAPAASIDIGGFRRLVEGGETR